MKKSDKEKEAEAKAADLPPAPESGDTRQPGKSIGFTAPIGKGGVRSAALRTTVADAGVARAPTKVPSTDPNVIPAGGGMNAVRRGGDQWGAWKEIQMQNVTMTALEEQLNNECQLLGIDSLQILVSIDSNLNSSGL